jgi:ankyrin repeat protein
MIYRCFLHRPNIVMRLLGVGANPNMVTSCGCGDIPSLAGQRASIEVVEMLYLAGAQFSRSNALHRAVQAAEYDNDRFAIMDFLLGNELVDINQLEYGYKAEGPNKWPGSGTALHCAVKTASLKSVKYLLSWKADLIVENRMGWTPLYMARRYGLKDIEKVLKDAEDTLRRDACKNG